MPKGKRRSEILPDDVPSWVRSNQEWWYTHQNARKAYNLLASQTRRGTLFAFLNPHLQAQATLPLPINYKRAGRRHKHANQNANP
ncbi:hypothetical protein HMPREF0580_1878 [Mobiluncus mulieris ATCC 35239]|uniref:Uncharacterized protein n=1 Tax=Mobiluncus mulieris ATCC 35239 TaxID=871571 RepID=E0QSL3_9ACTO|nr:hypothetical protein HMPREF0580_1878 [Mobiluncus mulieris ATCC 35239]